MKTRILMVVLYNSGIFLLRILYRAASWINPKAKAFLAGRKHQVDLLEKDFPLPGRGPLVWVHCASLGEFEQGRPVMESLKAWKPSLKILLTFYSPSGYEIRKDYPYADRVLYLPWDTKKNAKWFIDKTRPFLVIFVKYEFWYHYATELHKRNIPLISISTIFREDQIFFKSYGGLFRKMLKSFRHFFVQNQQSYGLLQSIGITSITLAGDTRFDRVSQIIRQAEDMPLVQQFKEGQKLMVIGSAWPEDMEILYPLINENKGRLKFIIAPHEIKEEFLGSMEKSIEGGSIRFSKLSTLNASEASVLIVDNIGMLSRLYRYGEFAFIGGGFGDGLHNILEAACYGIPIFFGNRNYQKFQEAVDLVFRGGAFEVGDYVELKTKYELMINHPETFLLACEVTRQYVLENLGASDKITAYCKELLSSWKDE